MCIVVVELVEVTLHKLLSLGGAPADKLRQYKVEGTSGNWIPFAKELP